MSASVTATSPTPPSSPASPVPRSDKRVREADEDEKAALAPATADKKAKTESDAQEVQNKVLAQEELSLVIENFVNDFSLYDRFEIKDELANLKENKENLSIHETMAILIAIDAKIRDKHDALDPVYIFMRNIILADCAKVLDQMPANFIASLTFTLAHVAMGYENGSEIGNIACFAFAYGSKNICRWLLSHPEYHPLFNKCSQLSGVNGAKYKHNVVYILVGNLVRELFGYDQKVEQKTVDILDMIYAVPALRPLFAEKITEPAILYLPSELVEHNLLTFAAKYSSLKVCQWIEEHCKELPPFDFRSKLADRQDFYAGYRFPYLGFSGSQPMAQPSL